MRIRIGASLLLASALWLGCGRDGDKSDSGGAADSNTAGSPVQNKACAEAPITAKALNECVSDLNFAEEELQGDQQRLMVVDKKLGPRLGPLGKIQPEVNSNQGTDRDLEQQGRVIALLTLDKSANEDYPKLAMFRNHKTYWWVKRGTGGTPGISMYISDSVRAGDTLMVVKKRLETYPAPGGGFKHALARWIWVPDDETSKGSCSYTTACR